jgi:thiol-disulfide isomerase/thioredoxin
MNKTDKFHIFLVTTEGCAGCKIMDRILRKVLDKTTDITYHVSDYTKFRHKKKELDKFRDFPTVLLVDDGEVKARIVGTEPEFYVINKIRQSFGDKVFKTDDKKAKETNETNKLIEFA